MYRRMVIDATDNYIGYHRSSHMFVTLIFSILYGTIYLLVLPYIMFVYVNPICTPTYFFGTVTPHIFHAYLPTSSLHLNQRKKIVPYFNLHKKNTVTNFMLFMSFLS